MISTKGAVMNISNRVAKRTITVVGAACLCLSLAPTSGWSAEQVEKTDGIRTVYLIRHGEYDHDDERDPEVGKGLVPLGVAQARIIGA
ncbi:MAG: hypothetical protein P8127_15065, partial [Acidobacteriota bacterium]